MSPVRPHRLYFHLSVALLVGLAATSAEARMYKWTDAEGNVQYTQTPPPGFDAERIAPAAPPPTPRPAPAPATPAEEPQGDEPGEGAVPQEARTPDPAEVAAQRAERCAKARDALTKLQATGRVRVTQADGTTVVMPEEERQANIDKAQQQIEKHCE
jgi:hypothetical protein